MRILAVDPGDRRIGLAISDPTGTIANPLEVLKHIARLTDAAMIASIARQNDAGLIIVGQALDDDGYPTPQSRKAERLAESIRSQTDLPVELWDESGSTDAARQAHIAMGGTRRSRQRSSHGHLDQMAATYILQNYLDAHSR